MKKNQSEKNRFLQHMADNLRIESIQMTSAAGSGHPTSCLSCAEIISVLFFDVMKYNPHNLESFGNDEFILSKGHAAPILYAAYAEAGSIRKSELDRLRKADSHLEGHPVPEVRGIRIATGSLGQGLSAGAGMALAKKKDGKNNKVFVLLGDGEMAEGSVWEAMNFASHYKLDNLFAVVDVNRLGQSGPTMFEWDMNTYAERAQSFGWVPIIADGHSVQSLSESFGQAILSGKPAIIFAKTVKGKNGGTIENKQGKHGKPVPEDEYKDIIRNLKQKMYESSFVPDNFIQSENRDFRSSEITISTNYTIGDRVATRTAFGRALEKAGEQDRDLFVLDGDVKNSTRAKFFFEAFPERSIECFIAEQNMIGVAMGLQSQGKRVAASSFAAFLTRAHDQFRMAVYSKARLTIAGSHTGVSIGEDGPSQMGLEDIAMMRSLFGSIVLSPSDAVSAEKCTAACLNFPAIAYIRTIRGKTPVLYGNEEEFPIGGSKVLRSSEQDRAAILTAGYPLFAALEAAAELNRQQTPVRLIDCYSLKPLDIETVMKAALDTGKILTVEDHYPEGGLGEAVSAAIGGTAIIEQLAVSRLPHSGTPAELLHEQGIDKEGIIFQVKKMLVR